MKLFLCGLCSENKREPMFRKAFRLHLKSHIREKLFNEGEREVQDCRKNKKRHSWVIEVSS